MIFNDFKLNSGKIDFGTIVLFLSYLDFLQILILHEMQRELDGMPNNSLNFVLIEGKILLLFEL